MKTGSPREALAIAVTTPRMKLPEAGATSITASTRLSRIAPATPSGSSGTCVTAPSSMPYSERRSPRRREFSGVARRMPSRFLSRSVILRMEEPCGARKMTALRCRIATVSPVSDIAMSLRTTARSAPPASSSAALALASLVLTSVSRSPWLSSCANWLASSAIILTSTLPSGPTATRNTVGWITKRRHQTMRAAASTAVGTQRNGERKRRENPARRRIWRSGVMVEPPPQQPPPACPGPPEG